MNISNIPDGTYQLIFSFGGEEITKTDKFLKPRGAFKFEKPVTFSTKLVMSEENNTKVKRTYYNQINVNLQKTADGNAKTSEIEQTDFDKY